MDRSDVDGDGSADDESRSLYGYRLRRLGHVVGVLLLLAIVIPFVLFAVPQLIGAEHSFVVLSGSMEPALGAGDVTFVDAVGPAAIERGDVINFKRTQDTRTTTHRVIEVVERDGERAFRTMGDNNEDPDQGVVTSAELNGRVMSLGGLHVSIPLVGYPIQFASTQTGFALLFVIPVTLLVINEVWNVVTSTRASSDDTVKADGGPDSGAESGSTESGSAESGSAESGSVDSDGTDDGDASGGGVSFRPAELRLGIAVLAAFVAYSGWVAYGDPTALTIGVTGSAAVALLMVGGLYVMGSSIDDEEESTAAVAPGVGPDDLVIHSSAVRADADDVQRESVSSLEVMIELAASTDGRLHRDPDEGAYHLSVGDTLYVYEPGTASDDESFTDGGHRSFGGGGPNAPGATESSATDESALSGPATDATTEADDD